jgi:biotin-dependent carboxylase-like uncharacterized protein
MSRAVLAVRFAGPLVTVQDHGRPGMARYGVPQSGPMDRLAFAAAQAALGNTQNNPVIEVSLGGLHLECLEGSVTIALAGGGFIAEIAGRKGGSWQVARLCPGDRLILRRGPWGAWCVLAFAGTMRLRPWLGSVATHAPSGLGGGAISTGQVIEIDEPRLLPDRLLPCPAFARPLAEPRVVLGPQDRFFGADQHALLLGFPWQLTPAYDRMGVRLQGPSLRPEAALDMPSEPVSRGSVQVAGDGVPTVLLADHQTTGGYPKIATLLSADLDRFSQLRPGDRFRLQEITPEKAILSARLAARQRAQWLESLVAHGPNT